MGNTKNFFKEKKQWSVIKDEILSWYLKPYFAKILYTKSDLLIIDCFAGKGKFEDGTKGSPLIIAENINSYISKYPNKINGIFIENKYSKDLKENLKYYSFCLVEEGSYEKGIEGMLNLSSWEYNLFLYIDPYGIKSLSFDYFKKLSEKKFRSMEVLLNLNTTGFLREGVRLLKYQVLSDDLENGIEYEEESNSIEKMNDIAGGDYWQQILKEFKNGEIRFKEAEEKFAHCYVEKLKSIFKYSLHIPIKEKSWHIPKYRMLFCTNHEDGFLLMADNMNKKWKNFINQEKEKEGLLFHALEFPDQNQFKKSLEETIQNMVENPIDLKKLIIKLIDFYGISYHEKDYIKLISDQENIKFEIQRNPSLTKTGKKAVSLDYNKYKIKIRKK